jgi:hypothetical protein
MRFSTALISSPLASFTAEIAGEATSLILFDSRKRKFTHSPPEFKPSEYCLFNLIVIPVKAAVQNIRILQWWRL